LIGLANKVCKGYGCIVLLSFGAMFAFTDKTLMMRFAFFIFLLAIAVSSSSQEVTYPADIHYFHLSLEGKPVKMAYMDIKPSKPNGQSILLLHGKNFNGFYWKNVLQPLSNEGFRIIVPDQVGWGRSDKPLIHYSFHMLANNTRLLLDSLNIKTVHVVGHSMGGMLAARFVLMFSGKVSKLVFENPIGLEDYKTFVPYQTVEQQFAKERKASFESYKKYQQSYYPSWKPEYELYVTAQAESLTRPDFEQTALVNALTYAMIYEQPIVYELKNIRVQTLIIIGQEDRTVVGKDLLEKSVAAMHGQYPKLGKWLNGQVKNSILAELKGVGHIPHIQATDVFVSEVLRFLKAGR
jgi:pimeloyl-ACP methyl ester carboxylesterase